MRTLSDIVAHYRAQYADLAAAERRYYAQQATLWDAVREAGLALAADGRRHPHQYRLPATLLAACCQRLKVALPKIRCARDFEALFVLVRRSIGPLHGVGELMIYDTSTRIGAKLGLEPQRVFLHSGVRKGARNLGLSTNRIALLISELPRPLRCLEPQDVEDVLCIYKIDLSRFAKSQT